MVKIKSILETQYMKMLKGKDFFYSIFLMLWMREAKGPRRIKSKRFGERYYQANTNSKKT